MPAAKNVTYDPAYRDWILRHVGWFWDSEIPCNCFVCLAARYDHSPRAFGNSRWAGKPNLEN